MATGQIEDPREASFHGGYGCLVEFDGDTERIDQGQVRTRWSPFSDAPRYSMRHREGAIVRLDIGRVQVDHRNKEKSAASQIECNFSVGRGTRSGCIDRDRFARVER